MSTKIMSASVKVMLSYDYSHFEASMSLGNDEGISVEEIDNARKSCQRLADKAVGQYKTFKSIAATRTNKKYEKEVFERQCKQIAAKEENDRTIKEIAMLKQYQDENWQSQFEDDDYDYMDDQKYKI